MELTQQQTEAFQRAAAICSRAEKCSNDLRQKMSQWGVDEDGADVVLAKLIEEKYIDDERYAHSFVKDKFRFNKWGKVKIAYQLRACRIDSAIVDSALHEINDDDYRELLVELIADKNRFVKAANLYDRKAKLLRFAQGRGFEMDLIYAAFNEILKEK